MVTGLEHRHPAVRPDNHTMPPLHSSNRKRESFPYKKKSQMLAGTHSLCPWVVNWLTLERKWLNFHPSLMRKTESFWKKLIGLDCNKTFTDCPLIRRIVFDRRNKINPDWLLQNLHKDFFGITDSIERQRKGGRGERELQHPPPLLFGYKKYFQRFLHNKQKVSLNHATWFTASDQSFFSLCFLVLN